jgi:hypothetical protein
MLSAFVRLFGCVATTSRTAESGGGRFDLFFDVVSIARFGFRDESGAVGVAVAATAPGNELRVGGATGFLISALLSAPHAASSNGLDIIRIKRHDLAMGPC